MKASRTLFSMVVIAFAIALAATTTAHAQGFPLCNGTDITIKNLSNSDVLVCVKQIDCFYIPAGDGISIPVTPGTEVPGIYGVAEITHEWQANPGAPPALWIPSIAMNPSGDCFDVTYDEPTCTILVSFASNPPCLNP
jgi:hypothetical protein